MKLKIFTIYDQKAHAYITPFFLPEEAMAIRTFGDCCNDKSHQFGRHPEDYTLFNIGAWADNTAQIVMNNAPITICNGLEMVKAIEDEEKINLELTQ
ncbi:nonstructural protein [Microviridae sp.]|nr:nonstructural protein [Microviridae sp.]